MVRTELAAPRRRARRPSTLDRLRAGAGPAVPRGDRGEDRQRLAAAVAAPARSACSPAVPGTGKTTTVAKMLALLRTSPARRCGSRWPRRPARPRPGCRRPCGRGRCRGDRTGSAADASTLHRLLGWRPGRSRFRHDRYNRLPYDVVVVDETSMVSLTMMARLLEAVRPDARLVLVGDPDQLASVEAGAVLGDLARGPRPARTAPRRRARGAGAARRDRQRGGHAGPRVAVLRRRSRRSRGPCRPATRTRRSRCCAAEATTSQFVETDSAAATAGGAHGRASTPGSRWPRAARRSDVAAALAALERHRVLCGHRRGPYGVTRWSREIERWLRRRAYRRSASTTSGTRDAPCW